METTMNDQQFEALLAVLGKIQFSMSIIADELIHIRKIIDSWDK